MASEALPVSEGLLVGRDRREFSYARAPKIRAATRSAASACIPVTTCWYVAHVVKSQRVVYEVAVLAST
jgi:hypothetical protein